jgi:hypothetical protein
MLQFRGLILFWEQIAAERGLSWQAESCGDFFCAVSFLVALAGRVQIALAGRAPTSVAVPPQ